MSTLSNYKEKLTMGINGEYKKRLELLADIFFDEALSSWSEPEVEPSGAYIESYIDKSINHILAGGLLSRRDSGIGLIAIERANDLNAFDYIESNEDKHVEGELAAAASCYAMPDTTRLHYPFSTKLKNDTWYPRHWPRTWVSDSWKPSPDDRIKELVKAGALIAAEIDRLIRLQSK